ncbi:MAG: nucleotidyl transferase AbiEii/AbiGii toxin family protein [Candidatus Yonathbacteria bacterium]|nr:nucleotidyl transferase AbiEii/AbiGii toxin family protein [Candidatus Yonathbacteria bacterium]
MALPNKNDAMHKAWLYRILERIADDAPLPTVLRFKGGTCASMLGWLDRFSVDLDFDYAGDSAQIVATRAAFERIFHVLGLSIKDSSKQGIQYFLRYDGAGRNTIKIDTSFPLLSANTYAPQRLHEIDRVLTCQTMETMFAHKLLALIGRSDKHGSIAGRDVYDVHFFFMRGYQYSVDVIREGSGLDTKDFFTKLYAFVDRTVTDKILSEDLNYLLPAAQFQVIRKVLKREALTLIRDEIARLS